MAEAERLNPDSDAVEKAKKASLLFDHMQTAWRTEIETKSREMSQYLDGVDLYNCKALKIVSDEFDRANGWPIIGFNYSGGLLGGALSGGYCKIPYGSEPSRTMSRAIVDVLKTGASSD